MTTDEFLKRRAADIVADPNYSRFVRAFHEGTEPRVPKEEIEKHFRAGTTTVVDVMEAIFKRYPQTVSLDVNVADIRRMGAKPEVDEIKRLERELTELRPPLEAWYEFIGESRR